MKVLTVIPAYKCPTLGNAIVGSVRMEVPDGWEHEVLVVCDGDPEMVEIVTSLRFPVRFMALDKNQGQGGALNAAIPVMRKFDAVSFCDADDVSFSTRLKVQLPLLGGGIVSGLCLNVYPDGRLVSGIKGYPPLQGAGGALHGTVTMSTQVLGVLGGWDTERVGADDDFFIRARRAGVKTVCDSHVVLLRHIHSTSLKQSCDRSVYRNYIRSRINCPIYQEVAC